MACVQTMWRRDRQTVEMTEERKNAKGTSMKVLKRLIETLLAMACAMW